MLRARRSARGYLLLFATLAVLLLHGLPTAAQTSCPGDCSSNGSVTVDDVITMVDVALGTANVSLCEAGDVNHNGQLAVNEIVAAVNSALSGCQTFAHMQFKNQTFSGSSLPGPIMFDGALKVSSSGRITGELTAYYGAKGSATIVAGDDGRFGVQVGDDQFDLLPNDSGSNDSGSAAINGVPMRVADAFAAFSTDLDSGVSPEKWSVEGQALLAVLGLTLTQSWSSNASVAFQESHNLSNDIRGPFGTAASIDPIWCEVTALGAGAVATGIAATLCTAAVASCVVGSTYTLGALVLPCSYVIGGICAGGAYLGVEATYRVVLAWWLSLPL